jgi:predicted dehydrogenase
LNLCLSLFESSSFICCGTIRRTPYRHGEIAHFEKANQSGKLGDPRFFDSEFAQQVDPDNVRVTEPIEKGGGPVYDMGVYCINAARYLFRAEPSEISAFSARNGEPRFKKKTRQFPKRDQFAAEIQYFCNCILRTEEPEPSGYEGLADVRVIEAIYQSVQSGRLVTLPPFFKKRRPTPEQEIHRQAHGLPKTVNAESPSGEAA